MCLKRTNFYQHPVMEPFSTWTNLRYCERNKNWLEFIKVFSCLWSRMCDFPLIFPSKSFVFIQHSSNQLLLFAEIKNPDTFIGFNQYDAISLHSFFLKTWRRNSLKIFNIMCPLMNDTFCIGKASAELEDRAFSQKKNLSSFLCSSHIFFVDVNRRETLSVSGKRSCWQNNKS